MTKWKKATLAVTTAALCLAGAPAYAESCWAKEEIAAAKVREMQSMLMVAALRCRASGINILPSYNAFVSANRKTIMAMNDRLKLHFWAAGPAEGQRRYDRFTTSLANAYGAGQTGEESCADMADLAQEAAMASGTGELIAIAERNIPSPRLPGSACRIVLADR